MTLSPLDDLAAICAAQAPEQLWRHLIAHPTLRAQWNDFDAVVAFKSLHGGGVEDAERTAALLCTDPRWRRTTATLIVRIEESSILTAAQLDALADGFLWEERVLWPVPHAWIRDGLVRVLDGRPGHRGAAFLERMIPPPLRRWAAARIVSQDPQQAVEVLDRVGSLEARAGDAAMTGLLDVCERLPEEARTELVELGCEWPSGTVRLRALELLAAHAPDVAARRAAADPSNRVRSSAGRLRAADSAAGGTTVDGPAVSAVAAGSGTPAPQLLLFG